MSVASQAPTEMRFESEVRSEQRALPLSQALAARFTYHTEAQWRERVDAGAVTRNGQPACADDLVQTGDRIVYVVRDYHEPAVPTHFEILFEDEEFLVAGKPAGIPVHHTGTIFWNTFASVLRRSTGNEELVPMHRLDRDTSGAMLFAKSQDTSVRYQKNLGRILLRKVYLAVVRGDFAQTIAGLRNVATEPGRNALSDGSLDVSIPLREQPGNEVRVQMVPDFVAGKPCRTVFRSLGPDAGGANSLVECELFTGRKHQIRAHLAALGHPILGDCIYSHGGKYYLKRCNEPLDAEDIAVLGAAQQLLHAWRIQLQLPSWREARWFESRIWSEELRQAIGARSLTGSPM